MQKDKITKSYKDIAEIIFKAKIKRANWVQKLILKGIIKNETTEL